jgi:hypothetical protein
MIKGKTPEEIRAHFNIQNDFTCARPPRPRVARCPAPLAAARLLRPRAPRLPSGTSNAGGDRGWPFVPLAPNPPFASAPSMLILGVLFARRPEEEEEVRRENAWCEDI